MTDANGGGDVDPVEIMLNALADAEADVRSGLYERGKAFSRLAQAAALTAIATSQRLDSAENHLARQEQQTPAGNAKRAPHGVLTMSDQNILDAVRPPVREVDNGGTWTFTYPMKARAFAARPTAEMAIRRALPPDGARLVGVSTSGVLAPDSAGARRICEVTDEDCDYVLVTLMYSVPQATDRTKDGHHHVWLSDGRCATPRCRALKGASTVAKATS